MPPKHHTPGTICPRNSLPPDHYARDFVGNLPAQFRPPPSCSCKALSDLKAAPALQMLHLNLSGNQLGRKDAEALATLKESSKMHNLWLNLSMNWLRAGTSRH